MTNVFTDGSGFAYLGDARYANHSLGFPTVDYLLGCPNSSIMSELPTFCTTSELQFRNVKTQTAHNTNFYNSTFLAWGGKSDTINDRWIFGSGDTSNTTTDHIAFYNNSGYIPTNNTFSGTNRLYRLANTNAVSWVNIQNNFAYGFDFSESGAFSQVQWLGVSDGDFFALAAYQINFTNQQSAMRLWYGGFLANINTNFNYYSENNITRQISFARVGRDFSLTGGTPVNGYMGGVHYIAINPKQILATGDAQYSFVCSDGQTPQATWLSDMYVFDNNATLGNPAMGRVRGMLLGTGTFTIGKPVKITGGVVPDSGSRWYLPIGNYAGKTVLMKCYSSVDL